MTAPRPSMTPRRALGTPVNPRPPGKVSTVGASFFTQFSIPPLAGPGPWTDPDRPPPFVGGRRQARADPRRRP